jgi:hypothetical protein
MGVSVFMCEKAFSQVPSYVPSNGLVGYWPFNGNANDESGNGLNGIFYNGTYLTSPNNQSANFNGSNSLLSIPINPFFNTDTFSISIKIKNNISPFHNPIQLGIVNGALRWSIGFQSNQIYYAPMTCSGGWGASGNYAASLSLINSNWYHIVWSNEGTRTKFYVDGILVGDMNNAIATNCWDSNMMLYLGGDIGGGTIEYYSGEMDELAFWKRALTQQEISVLYNGCSASTITTQPTNQTVNPTTSAQFVVNATSGSSFQWQTDLGLGFQNLSNAGQYSGATNDTLWVSNVSSANNNQQFRCIVNSASCADTSDIAVLSVSTVGINELSVQGNVSLYPNPTQSSFEIQTSLVYSKIEIRDMQGRIVKTENAAKTINLSSLQKGTYSVNLLDEQEKTLAVRKIVLQ